MTRISKVDANQPAIVKALRALGCSVQSLAAIGKGCPDLLVARNGRLTLMEIKDGTKPPSQRRLTDDEIEWIQKWKSPVHIVEDVDDAIAAMNL